MDKFRVQGPTRLQGEVTISGAKKTLPCQSSLPRC